MFQKLPNPDNVPGAVTSGYQRQNTNFFAIQTGIDTTEPYDNGTGTITIPTGGVVDINGVLYRITANIILNKPNPDRMYWIALKASTENNTAVARLITRPYTWDSTKKACYTPDNERVLNYVSLGGLNSPTSLEYSSPNAKGDYKTQLKNGWKYVQLTSGLGGGNGGNGTNSTLGLNGIEPILPPSNITGSIQGGAGGNGGNNGIGGIAGIANICNTSIGIFLYKGGNCNIRIGANGSDGERGWDGGKGGHGGKGGNGWRISAVTGTPFLQPGKGGRGGDGGGGGGGGGSGGGETSSLSCQDYFLTTNDIPGGHGGIVPPWNSQAQVGWERSTEGYGGRGASASGEFGEFGREHGGVPGGVASQGYDGPDGAPGRDAIHYTSVQPPPDVTATDGSGASNGSGGAGGAAGIHGKFFPDGSPGGNCIIYSIN